MAAPDAQRDPRERAKPDAATKPEDASKAVPFINSLGMEFVPVKDTPGLLWSRPETRVQDLSAFCEETGRPHERPDFQQASDHPSPTPPSKPTDGNTNSQGARVHA